MTQDEFWQRVNKEAGEVRVGLGACWAWTLKPERCGYARVRREDAGGARVFVHRLSWEIAFGEIPAGLYVLHRCDNRVCVRPEHLFIGTLLENARDRNSKGRQSRGPRHAAACFKMPVLRGERSTRAKLSAADVVTLRLVYAAGGVRQDDLAAHYRVDRKTVGLAVDGTNWSHLDGIAPPVRDGAARRSAIRRARELTEPTVVKS